MDNIKEQASIFIYDGGIGFQSESCTVNINIEPSVFVYCLCGFRAYTCEYEFKWLKTKGNILFRKRLNGGISINLIDFWGSSPDLLEAPDETGRVVITVRDAKSREIFLTANVSPSLLGEMLYRSSHIGLYQGAEIELKNLDKIGKDWHGCTQWVNKQKG